MKITGCLKNKSLFVMAWCLLLWTASEMKNVFAWELEELQERLREAGARWTAGETSLTHLSQEEFTQMLGFKVYKDRVRKPAVSKKSKYSLLYNLPSSFDWRDLNGGNWITPIKNQQLCGGCYSFATLGTLETLIKLDQDDPDFDVDLSEQYLISCGPSGDRGGYDYGGCLGNYTDYTCDFLVSAGAPDESCFTYNNGQQTGSEPSCNDACSDVVARVYTISSYTFIASGGIWYVPSVEDIKLVVVNKPVPCGFYVYGDFQNYVSGVYEPLSSQTVLGGHMVYIVGYDDSQSCWIVKNSWGTGWGESGFFRISYNQTSESSLTLFGMDAVDLNYGDPVTTSTLVSSTTTTAPVTTTTTSVAHGDIPNLTPCTPSGWSSHIVPSSQQGTNTYDPATDILFPSPQSTYIDFALCNENGGDATESFVITLYIDDVEAFTAEAKGGLAGISCKTWVDEAFSISEGEHTLRLVVDVNNDIEEASEDDNEFEIRFAWGSAGWPVVYREMLGDEYTDTIHLLRDFRDKVLVTTKTGKAWVELFYRNSFEIASLLLENKELRVCSLRVVEEIIPEISALLNREEAVLSSRMSTAIAALLDEFEVKASPEIKMALKRVKKEMKKKEIFDQMRIKPLDSCL